MQPEEISWEGSAFSPSLVLRNRGPPGCFPGDTRPARPTFPLSLAMDNVQTVRLDMDLGGSLIIPSRLPAAARESPGNQQA